ncbi:hypothetical protein WJX84_007901 [Apatococcus fuscideae]|uniref:Alpha-1,3-glucosyltransferase n=1 Tax=Apatococcus fuscideae TaxID=2026836 RepID=A0AAW1SVB4_9CHLO
MLGKLFTYPLCVSLLVIGALLLRCVLGLHPYSGAQTPPTFGDYEAQRHWMEIALHTPPRDWYQETLLNPLHYWGLDYPPLSAYQSWLCGKVLNFFEPESVALGTSRGFETQSSKVLMRWTVLASDLLVYFPAVLVCAAVFGAEKPPEQRLWLLAAALLQPALLLMDHGHFQYNCISLGFTAGAAAAIASNCVHLGSGLFCLALNHKHMAAYFAPAFFAHLLGRCLQQPTALHKVRAVAGLGLVVLGTFGILWAPWLGSWAEARQVLVRLIPLSRGIFEDYVANFWCVSNVVVKWKLRLTQQALAKACLVTTLAAILPGMLSQVRRPSRQGLLLAMAQSSLSFFLFSYQVHEKSILFPLLPISLLAIEYPVLAAWFPAMAAFSMFPLLMKDNLRLAYIGCLTGGNNREPIDQKNPNQKETEPTLAV